MKSPGDEGGASRRRYIANKFQHNGLFGIRYVRCVFFLQDRFQLHSANQEKVVYGMTRVDASASAW